MSTLHIVRVDYEKENFCYKKFNYTNDKLEHVIIETIN